jgi:Tol biopolymer transport system component
MFHNLSNADRSNDYKALGFSVRCIEDPIPDSAKYLGQTPPGNKAVKFAPGIISKPGRMEYKVAFSPDGKECFINVGEGTGYKVYSTKRVNNTWTEQTVASFSANQSTEFSSFSVDGNKVFFDINEDIWMSERTNTGWNEAQKLSSPVNTSSHESGYSETVDSTMYFTSDRPGSITSPIYKNLDIWTINKTTNQAENIGNIINSSTWDVTPCIAPDGSYLIYTKGDGTTMDLFISFKKEDSSWTTPLNMDKSGTNINVINQNSPSLSPDGKYLFFNRHDQDSADIYWVSTSIIDTLKKKCNSYRVD